MAIYRAIENKKYKKIEQLKDKLNNAINKLLINEMIKIRKKIKEYEEKV